MFPYRLEVGCPLPREPKHDHFDARDIFDDYRSWRNGKGVGERLRVAASCYYCRSVIGVLDQCSSAEGKISLLVNKLDMLVNDLDE